MKLKLRAPLGKRVACIGLTALMGATLIAGHLTAFANNGGDSSQSYTLSSELANGKVNLSGVKLANMSKQVQKNLPSEYANVKRTVIVSLKGKALSDREGESGAEESIKDEQKKFLRDLKQKGISYRYKSSYSTIINAVAIEVRLSDLQAIKAMGGVSTVSVSSTYARPAEVEGDGSVQRNFSSIYKTGIYDSSEFLESYADGTGMTVAILDTGIDYTHTAFDEDRLNDKNAVAFKREDVENKMADVEFRATARTGATVDDVYVSAKVPFAYDYADSDSDVYPSYSQHGTHVAGIVAGKADEYTDKDGNTATDGNGNKITFRGVAPEAQLVICKVFTDDLDDKDLGGAETENILDALEDCYNLNVDVINMSLGTSAGFSSASLGLTPEDEEGALMKTVYEKIRHKGITLDVAASNDYSAGYGSAFGTNLASNPDSGTVGSPSTFSGALSVASINGQFAPYMLAKDSKDGADSTGKAVYYEESRNEDSDAYNFLNDLLGDPEKDSGAKQRGTFKYVVVPGTGEATDYTENIINELKDKSDGPVIAVIRRGGSTFKDKLVIAKEKQADAVIVYNNVSGLIRMSLGDLQERIPAISVSMDAGLILTGSGSAKKSKGYLTLDRAFEAGPFMNDYSSWGATPDLKLKPDVTSHGGEITSTVAGGYDEMSGTSMACPNLAGFTALLKGYLRDNCQSLWQTSPAGAGKEDADAFNLTKLTNAYIMSTATTVYDQNGLPYSPRKQGSGLATLKNVLGATASKAYLYTDEADGMCEDGRPKAELGADTDKKGEYKITFYVKNFGNSALTFKPNSLVMTESMGADGKSVAEKAHLFSSSDASWKVDGVSKAEGESFSVAAGDSAKIEVEIKLSDDDKYYLDANFKNGMFIEGFLQLKGSGDQCDLTLPYLGFYGDWKKMPMLDYDCFTLAEYDKDSSIKDEERPQPSVWATQAYSYYWNDKYTTPLGSFLYLQDEEKEHTAEYVYPTEEHVAISRFNEYYGDNDNNNYLTVTGIKALYAGLLRNAELVTYTLTNVDTGEIIPDENGKNVREIYRVNKAYAGGGSSIPAQVLLEMRTDELGLAANGKYRLDFGFYFDYDDYDEDVPAENSFSMSFYVDYEAPVLVDSRMRYQDRKDENGKDTQRVYLDLDVYDNHYPQAVILCYSDTGDATDTQSLKLATEYITPILNPKKNTVNTVSIDITEFYDEYKGKLFVELDDYALNHNVYAINLNHSQTVACSEDFTITQGSEITLSKNAVTKLTLENIGSANLSNYIWSSGNPDIVKVKNGEIFGVKAGTATVFVRGANGHTETIKVTVTDEGAKELKLSAISFGAMLNSDEAPVKAQGVVKVNPGQSFTLSVNCDPWYYPTEGMEIEWTSDNPALATVDSNGNVKVLYEDEKIRTVTISASYGRYTADVVLSIQNPFTISNGSLTRYEGLGGELKDGVVIGGETFNGVRVLTIPTDKAITSIASEAFKEKDNIEVVVIPKSVTTIAERAFIDCKNLKKICFVTEESKDPDVPSDSSLTLISRDAFSGCTSLTTVDLSNCKIITVDKNTFAGCTSLKNVINMQAIGTAYAGAFAGCTSLEEADLTNLHIANSSVDELTGYKLNPGIFEGCTSLSSVTLGKDTALGEYMFSSCTSLEEVTVNNSYVSDWAFADCSALKTVNLGANLDTIGKYAFANCSALTSFNLNGHTVKRIGDYAFNNCAELADPNFGANKHELGREVFGGVQSMANGVDIESGVLYLAPNVVNSTYAANCASVTSVAPYAFSASVMIGVDELDLSAAAKIGEGAFAGLKGLRSVTLSDSLTEIADYAFAGTGLTEITIPASVTMIGANAFEGCVDLQTVTFAGTPAVKEIGELAFAGTAISTVSIPASVRTVGSAAFSACRKLTSAEIPAVEKMGNGVFTDCPALASATFGGDAKTTGNYTFLRDAKLETVVLGDKITAIGAGAFAYCTSLEEIDLSSAATVGDEAFAGCTKLATVTGMENLCGTDDDVPTIGYAAFAYCSSLTSVNLAAAKSISYRAFLGCTELVTVNLGDDLEGIGDEAFAECAVNSVSIPASCGYVGVSAFSGARNLAAYTVSRDNPDYFAEEGVLYRNVGEGTYELCAYPLGRTATKDADGSVTYTVKEGTVTIQAFAFYGVPETKVKKVVLPYTLKTLGNGAFYNCGVTVYEFNSIAAPVLLEGVSERIVQGESSTNSFFYNNFVSYIADLVPLQPGEEAAYLSTLTILCPTNGTGYDNLIYSSYFAKRTLLGELPEDATRELKALIESFEDAETVKGWGNKSKEEIIAFSEQVKKAHGLYNEIKTDTQREYVGQTNIDKLFAIEQALKPIKKALKIPVTVLSVVVDSSSTHRSEYGVGEKFDLDGLVLLVTYDDYSQEVVPAKGNFVLGERFDRALRISDEAVTFEGTGEYLGSFVSVPVVVTEEGAKGEGLAGWAIALIVVGSVLVLAGATFVVMFVLLRKGILPLKGDPESQSSEAGIADGEPEFEDEPESAEEQPEAEATAEKAEKPAEPAPEEEKKENTDDTEPADGGDEGKTDD